jgi:CopG family nickel-responsive transcriptional regulator
MPRGRESASNFVARTSFSLPENLLTELDRMIVARGYESRSQAIADMIHSSLVEHKRVHGDDVMVGTITLFYDNTSPGLKEKLANLQSDNITEVISSLHVHLEHKQTLEVILVQGPPSKLQEIADMLITCKGVITGRVQLIAALIPQVHPLPKADRGKKRPGKRRLPKD